MKKEYKNEAYRLFDKCTQNENILIALYGINILCMILICFNITGNISSLINNVIIILNVIYIILSGYNDICLKNKAENELRKTMLADSFKIIITTTKSEGYFSNDEQPSIKRMGINNFESIIYTCKITEKMILGKVIKFLILMMVWIIIGINFNNLELYVLLSQVVFSADIFLDCVKLIYYYLNVKILKEKMFKLFVTDGFQDKDIPIIIEYVMEYEALKNYCHIVLPNKIFDSVKEDLEKEWNSIKSYIKEKKA